MADAVLARRARERAEPFQGIQDSGTPASAPSTIVGRDRMPPTAIAVPPCCVHCRTNVALFASGNALICAAILGTRARMVATSRPAAMRSANPRPVPPRRVVRRVRALVRSSPDRAPSAVLTALFAAEAALLSPGIGRGHARTPVPLIYLVCG